MSFAIEGLKANHSIPQLLKIFNQMQNQFHATLINYIKYEYVFSLYWALDNIVVNKKNGKETKPFLIEEFNKTFSEMLKNRKQEDVVVCFYPLDENTTLIQNYSSHIYEDIFTKLEFEDYSYNSENKPEEFTTKAWQKRYDDWKSVMPDFISDNNSVQYHPLIYTKDKYNVNWSYNELKELFVNLTPEIRLQGYHASIECYKKQNINKF
jgi:hypothetical protein